MLLTRLTYLAYLLVPATRYRYACSEYDTIQAPALDLSCPRTTKHSRTLARCGFAPTVLSGSGLSVLTREFGRHKGSRLAHHHGSHRYPRASMTSVGASLSTLQPLDKYLSRYVTTLFQISYRQKEEVITNT